MALERDKTRWMGTWRSIVRIFAELAEDEIVMGTYYWTLLAAETDKDCKDKEKCQKWSGDVSKTTSTNKACCESPEKCGLLQGKEVYDALVAAAQRGISIRIAVNTPDPNGNGFAREHSGFRFIWMPNKNIHCSANRAVGHSRRKPRQGIIWDLLVA